MSWKKEKNSDRDSRRKDGDNRKKYVKPAISAEDVFQTYQGRCWIWAPGCQTITRTTRSY